jgi:hypothetical protein
MVNLFSSRSSIALGAVCFFSSLLPLTPCSAAQKASTTAAPAVSKLSVTFDAGPLAKTLHPSVIPETPNNFDEPPFMNGEPEHLRVSFDRDKISDYGADLQRQLLVYPVAAYAQLFKGKEKVEFAKTVSLLKTIVSKRTAAGFKELPMLPAVEAYELFHNHVKILDYKDGSGVAFIACYAQDEAPIKNGDFFYSYQGLSRDNKYYISLTYPVKANKLKDNMPLKTSVKLLSNLQDKEFTPSLSEIDKMIESLSIK